MTMPEFWFRRGLADAIVVGEDLKFESSGWVGGYIGEHWETYVMCKVGWEGTENADRDGEFCWNPPREQTGAPTAVKSF